MIDYEKFHKDGYGSYKLEELLSPEDIIEFNTLANEAQLIPIDDEKYQYIISILGSYNDPEWPFKVPTTERIPRLQKMKDLGLRATQRWYESAFDPINYRERFQLIIHKFIRNFYPEINDNFSNIQHQGSLTVYTDGDHTEIHRDGQNTGRICAVLIYLTPEEEYNNSGDLVVIGDDYAPGSKYNLTVKPVRGNIAILDFNNHNAFHGVLPVNPNFIRHCYLTFVWNKDKMPYNLIQKGY